MLSISESKLSKVHAALAKEVEQLVQHALKLGAKEGVQRVTLICDQYHKLSPDTAYHLIDPGAFQREVEEAQSRKVEIWHIIRNCISLLPLILTWFALFSATSSYQACIDPNTPVARRCDTSQSQSFLTLWQMDGFKDRTITFSTAALLDVMLLLLYLTFILITYWLDWRTHQISASFSENLQKSTEAIMKAVSDDGITALASDADVDRVANAVQHVVEKAVRVSEQIGQQAQESIAQLSQSIQQSSQHTLEATQLSNQQTVQAIQQSNQLASQAAQQTLGQMGQMVEQTNQQAIQMIQQTAQQMMQVAQQSSEQLFQTALAAIAESNSKTEALFNQQIMPMMTTFNSDMVRLHNELDNYQSRLNDLTIASKQLAGASTTLVGNADRYITIGKDISDQVTALQATQQQVHQQMAGVVGMIGSVASEMSAATAQMGATSASMIASTRAVEEVATQLTAGLQATLDTMTTQVNRATQSLGQVGTELQTTAYHLERAASILSSLQFGGRGGLIGWMFSRWSNRRRVQGQGV